MRRKSGRPVSGFGWLSEHTKAVLRLSVVFLALLGSSPCAALSEWVGAMNPASPEEAAHWIDLFGLKSEPWVRLKSVTLHLRDVTLLMVRVESAACVQDVCPTFFRYELGKVFEFVIPCKEGFLVLDVPTRDSTGKYVESIDLEVGHGLTSLVTPSSFGPVITASRHKIP